MELQRVGHDWPTNTLTLHYKALRRDWQRLCVSQWSDCSSLSHETRDRIRIQKTYFGRCKDRYSKVGYSHHPKSLKPEIHEAQLPVILDWHSFMIEYVLTCWLAYTLLLCWMYCGDLWGQPNFCFLVCDLFFFFSASMPEECLCSWTSIIRSEICLQC